MAKKQTTEETNLLEETLTRLNKTYGTGSIMTMETKTIGDYDIISSGSIGLDWLTLGVGGFVKGKLYELMGWEGCLSSDTFIKHINVRKDGVVQDCKGSTLENLYRKFHNRTNKTQDTTFNVTSINDENKVFRNKILDVVKTGVKECFLVTTKKGFSLKATKDHKFYTNTFKEKGNQYLPLEKLSEGSIIYVHNNTHFTKKLKRNKYHETTIKWYYKGKKKKINGSFYFRERKHRLVFEANMNNISYKEYKDMLNVVNELPKNWNTIPEGYDIHHIDENTSNNVISNLQMIKSDEHARQHAYDNHNNLRFIVVEDEIESIISVGNQETYDIKCEFPYNNYIAEGIVVHNCGKTTICGHAAAECQKQGGTVLYIDGEHALDTNYFSQLGVDISKLIISQPTYGEEGFNIAVEMINTGEIDLVIIDSDSSLIPKKAIDGDVGDSTIGLKARLNSNAYPKLKGILSKKKVCVIVISQYREKIGVMFGNPTTTQGGHALKFYSDCRLEISRTLAKDGDVNYGNITKFKAVKNKMFTPYLKCDFEIIFGQGIDKVGELITLLHDHELGKKYGKSFTYKDVKYDVEEFKQMLLEEPDFFDSVKNDLISTITNIKKE